MQIRNDINVHLNVKIDQYILYVSNTFRIRTTIQRPDEEFDAATCLHKVWHTQWINTCANGIIASDFLRILFTFWITNCGKKWRIQKTGIKIFFLWHHMWAESGFEIAFILLYEMTFALLLRCCGKICNNIVSTFGTQSAIVQDKLQF